MKIPTMLTCALLTGSLLVLGACDSFLDVNEDPTAPDDVPEHLMLSGIQGVFSYNVIGSDPARVTSLWTQQTAWTGFIPHEDNYDVDESTINNLWNTTYTEVLNNAAGLLEMAEENETHAYAGMARVITAWSFSILTDLWDDVPYTEAFQPLPEGTSTPSYDSQEFIYSEIFSLLENALADFAQFDPVDPAYAELGTHDQLYGGDIERWERLIHTLIARFQMRLSRAPGHAAETQAQAALAALENGFMSNADDADFQYFSGEGQENPWYQFAIDSKWDTRNQMSAHYIELLEELEDPRLPVQARPAGAIGSLGPVAGFDPDEPEYIGHENGTEGQGAPGVSSIGEFYSAPNAPLNWISFAEAKFIEAEAHLILDDPVAAQEAHEEGIRSSMEKLGIPEAEIDEYVDDQPSLIDLITEDEPLALNDIITQKYIANFLNYEVYNDWRRTGYPELEPVPNALTPSGIIPLRFPYPNSELSYNAANVAETGVPVGYPALEIPVWWDSGN